MIAFSCAHCAMKFQVKDEFAGRSTRCPTCKNPLTVPPAPAAAVAPPSHFDGPLSTLARARLACDVTLGGPPPVSNGAAARPVAAVLADRQADGQRYVLEGEIARGGMGAVLRAVDRDIRREVAWAAHQVGDLTPLRGMPLTKLILHRCSSVRDLSPLRGMQLTLLHLGFCGQVQDLSPLDGMPLKWLSLGGCRQVHDLSPLTGMPLKWLSIWGSEVRDLSPLRGPSLTSLDLRYCRQVRDLSPLKGNRLTEITLPPQVDRGMSVLRQIKSLENINEMPAKDFWDKYDAREFKRYNP